MQNKGKKGAEECHVWANVNWQIFMMLKSRNISFSILHFKKMLIKSQNGIFESCNYNRLLMENIKKIISRFF